MPRTAAWSGINNPVLQEDMRVLEPLPVQQLEFVAFFLYVRSIKAPGRSRGWSMNVLLGYSASSLALRNLGTLRGIGQ